MSEKCRKKSAKKCLQDCLQILPTGGTSGSQIFPQCCAPRESLITLGTSLGQIFPDNPFGLFTVCTIHRQHMCTVWHGSLCVQCVQYDTVVFVYSVYSMTRQSLAAQGWLQFCALVRPRAVAPQQTFGILILMRRQDFWLNILLKKVRQKLQTCT